MPIQTATNPKTGARLAFVDDQWKPIEQSATNPQGLKAYKIGGSWLTDEEMATAASEMMAGDVPAASAPAPAGEIPGQRLTRGQEIYQAARPYIAPVMEVGGALVGGLYGAGAGALGSPTLIINPLTGAMVGSGLGYGIAKEGLEAADVAMGMKQPRQGMEQVTTPLANVAEGGAYELGGQALGKVVGAAYKPTVNYLSKVMNPKAAVLAAAAEGKPQAIINALRNYDEFVAQGMPTAGVAAAPAGSTKYAALQQEVAPFATTPYFARGEANVAARREALGTIAQDEKSLAAAKQERAKAVKPLYGPADKQVIKADDAFVDLLERPSMEKAIARAKQLAKERNEVFQIGKNVPEQKVGSTIVDSEGLPLDTKTLPAEYAKFTGKSLHYLKLALDDLIKDPKTFGLGSNEVSAITDTRKEFLKWFENKSAKYAEARATYAEKSKPINVMQVGQYLEGKLIPSVVTSTAERAGVFSEAVKNAPGTIKKSTGQERYLQLTDVLSPDQVKIVNGIRADLAREAQFEAQAAAGSQAGKLIPAEELAKSPAFFSKLATLANTISRALQGKINDKIAIELAAEMLDPKLAAASLEKAMARQAAGERFVDPFKGVNPVSAGGRVIQATPGALAITGKNALAPENQNNLRAR
jgi:hypothetical protein